MPWLRAAGRGSLTEFLQLRCHGLGTQGEGRGRSPLWRWGSLRGRQRQSRYENHHKASFTPILYPAHVLNFWTKEESERQRPPNLCLVGDADRWLGVGMSQLGCHDWQQLWVLRSSGLGRDLRLCSVCVNLTVTGWWNRWLCHLLSGYGHRLRWSWGKRPVGVQEISSSYLLTVVLAVSSPLF